MEYTDNTDSSKSKIVEKTVDGVSKKFIKGERLKLYPTVMPLFSVSRGMTRATVEKMSNGEAMEHVKDCKMVYQETSAIGEGKGDNLVNKR